MNHKNGVTMAALATGIHMNPENKPIDQLSDILNNIFMLYDRWAKDRGLNSNVFCILYALYPERSSSQSDICNYWNIAKQTVSTLSNELLDQGLLHIETDSSNRRRKLMRLTEAGRDYARPFIEPLQRAEAEAFASLGEERGQLLIAGFSQFQEAFAAALKASTAE